MLARLVKGNGDFVALCGERRGAMLVVEGVLVDLAPLGVEEYRDEVVLSVMSSRRNGSRFLRLHVTRQPGLG